MKVGLVLSGGGLKGNAHVGVLKALEELGVRYDVITGTSVGAIITGMCLVGMSTDEMFEVSTHFDKSLLNINFSGIFKTIWRIATFRKDPLNTFRGFISGTKLNAFFDNVYQHKNLNDFEIPFAIVATDLVTGKEIVMSNKQVSVNNCDCVSDVSLAQAIRASISVPLVFTPTSIGKYDLVDGGILDNLPVDAAKALGADVIIGVNLEFGASEKEADSLIEIGGKAVQLLTNRSQFYKNFIADVYINPDLSEFTTDDFSPIDAKKMMEIGYNSTMAVKDQILTLLKK